VDHPGDAVAPPIRLHGDVVTTASVSSPRRRRLLWLGLVAAAAVAVVAVVAWLVFRDDGSSTPQPSAADNAPVLVTAATLRTIARVVPQPIYWAGPEAGTKYELTRAANGDVYVRYLPEGVKAGGEEGKHLIVATYPFEGAYAALQKVGGGQERQVPGGGIAVPAQDPKSVHVAFPGVDYQVEVYDPSPEKALEVATSGRVKSAG
jgi:hypothetical protein